MANAALVAALAAAVSGCGFPGFPATTAGETDEQVRGDVQLSLYRARMRDGVSDPIDFSVPEGISSILIEVRGRRGRYDLAEFLTPDGRDLARGGGFLTREARELPGLINWLYPNDPNVPLQSGNYELVVGDDRSDGKTVSEDLEVRIYAVQRKTPETCGIHLDFLVDDRAIEIDQAKALAQELVGRVDRLYRQVGIKVTNSQMSRVNLEAFDVHIGDSARSVVDDVLRQAREQGGARNDALHVLLVRELGGSLDSASGYAMGLPGPYDADRPNAAVLVATSAFAEKDSLGADELDDMASTVAHEIGHFLGLYHTSEPDGSGDDPIPDTPECSSPPCPLEVAQNIMTSQASFFGPARLRTVLTPGQGVVMRRHPLCVPMPVETTEPPPCELACGAQQTCAILSGTTQCAQPCDPTAGDPCPGAACSPDERGTYVCR